MKRLSLLGFGLLASILAGCPVWSGDSNESQGNGGDNGGCSSSVQCGANFTCGSDDQCHPGDCTSWGCSAGYVCMVNGTTATASCEPGSGGAGGVGGAGSTSSTGGTGTTGTTGSGAGATTGSGAGSTTGSGASTGTGGAPPVVYCGHPSDCATGYCGADGTCQPGTCAASTDCIYGYTCQAGACASPTPGACDKDSDCASGSVCIAGTNGLGGVCTTPTNQCFDSSQCDPNDNCVAGTCTVSCSSNTDCRDGYTCNTTLGSCTTIATPCKVTNDCGGASMVCVGGACVPRSGSNGTCPAGDVWDENGCIPNQAATFTCTTDGQLGDGQPGDCAAGSICLHRDCWISCDSPNQDACATQDNDFNTCKPVTSSSGTYNICGSSMNLGDQCGQGANNMTCTVSGDICIDGFCE